MPEIRFEGFDDEWEQHKLGEVADIVGGGTPNTSNPDYWDGDINWFAPAEIGDSTYVDSSVRKITEAGYNACSATMLPAGKTVLFTSRAGIGSTAILRRSACTNQGFQSLVVHNDVDEYFVYSMSPAIKSWAEIHAVGSTFLEISGKVLASMPVQMPPLPEQRVIGSFFRDLDNLIALHQRKHEKLRKAKTALLGKMFPKLGETEPEVRFPGFTGPWEQRKLGELLALLKDGTHGTHRDATDGPYLLSAKNIKDGRLSITSGEERRISWSDFKRIHTTFDLKADDILMTIVGTIGEATLLKQPGQFTFQRSVAYLRPSQKYDSKFLLSTISTPAFQRQLDSRKSISAQPGVYLGDVSSLSVPFCSIPEQRLVGAFFRGLDDLIALHQRKLEMLRKVKKSLLGKMFV